ncbi:3 beta-hydroxysteroid dehydrogenase type 7-like [Calypte anna]|uniref:3 beta-hydroxysteroid dehydrogenase type 7-like n=1 Tax=Calypte anna TaxID=9244 RepID=UPI0011C37CF9|nr:3 beta-hydroxysteroid dehydrogenase type 7-like [Calypte anna]
MERGDPPDLRGRVVVVTGGAGFPGDAFGADAAGGGTGTEGAAGAGPGGTQRAATPGPSRAVAPWGRTLNVLAGCRSGGVKVLIYTSSMEVVGPNALGDPFLRGEEQTPYPVRHSHPYGRSKAQAERRVLEGNGMEVAGGGFPGVPVPAPHGDLWGGGLPLLAQIYREGKAGGGCPTPCPPTRSTDGCMWLLGLPPGGHFLPRVLLLLWAHLNSFLARFLPHFHPLLTPSTLAIASAPFTVRSSKAQRLLGYRPRYSWEEAQERTRKWSRSLD